MRYALVVNGTVSNVIEINDSNAGEFSNSIKLYDRPVAIGDTYANGHFYRYGAEVLTVAEQLITANATIAELDLALLDAEYNNIIGGMA